MGSNPKILGRADSRKPRSHPQKYPDTGRNALAVYAWHKEPRKRGAGVVHIGLGSATTPRKQRNSTRLVSGLCVEREALSEIPGVFSQIEAASSCDLG